MKRVTFFKKEYFYGQNGVVGRFSLWVTKRIKPKDPDLVINATSSGQFVAIAHMLEHDEVFINRKYMTLHSTIEANGMSFES